MACTDDRERFQSAWGAAACVDILHLKGCAGCQGSQALTPVHTGRGILSKHPLPKISRSPLQDSWWPEPRPAAVVLRWGRDSEHRPRDAAARNSKGRPQASTRLRPTRPPQSTFWHGSRTRPGSCLEAATQRTLGVTCGYWNIK